MNNNTSISLGVVVMMHQIWDHYGLFKNLFNDRFRYKRKNLNRKNNKELDVLEDYFEH
jgi:hypothetical protein